MAQQHPTDVDEVLESPPPRARLALAEPSVSAVVTDVPDDGEEEAEFRSFGMAILLGIIIGIPALGALVAGGVLLAAPDTDLWAVLGIAFWVSLFCGPFLAGTVTVGLWSSRQH